MAMLDSSNEFYLCLMVATSVYLNSLAVTCTLKCILATFYHVYHWAKILDNHTHSLSQVIFFSKSNHFIPGSGLMSTKYEADCLNAFSGILLGGGGGVSHEDK